MTLENSYRILGIDIDSNEAERFKAYGELREKLNRKLANAPTVGLKEKYKRALEQLDEAIEQVESSIDADELPILNEVLHGSQTISSNLGGTVIGEAKPSSDESHSSPRGRYIALILGIVALVVFLFVWRQHVEKEKIKIATAEMAQAEKAKEIALASARSKLEPLKQPFVVFSELMGSIFEDAETRKVELETAKQVADREGSEQEREISKYRMEQYAGFVDWLRDYLGKYSVDDKLDSFEKLLVEKRFDEARQLFAKPVLEITILEQEIEQAEQEKYELPVREFLAKREFDLVARSSRKALARLDFETAAELIKPYVNSEYIGDEAKSELSSLYQLKAEDAFKRAQHAIDIGEFQMAQRILDTLENDPIADERSETQLKIVELLNSEYAFEESLMVSRNALEVNDYEEARKQWTYLVDDPYVGERAKIELVKVDGLSEAWERAKEAKEIEAQQAISENESINRIAEKPELEEFDKPPRIVSESDPIYPDNFRRRNVSGYVELEWSIGVDGRVTGISVLSSSHYEFESPAIEAVRRWRFEPAQKNGNAVSVKVRQKLLFNPK